MTSTQSKKSPYRFGDKLRAVRERKGFTLKTVAQKAGVSESLVSQIERNKVSPAIDTLLSLAEVLEISLEFLFEEYHKTRQVQIIHSNERKRIEEELVCFEEIADSNDATEEAHAIESYIITIPPGSKTHRGSYGHPGRELGLILEGSGQFHYETKIYELSTGDSISFSASSPHILVNNTDKPLKAVWVVTPPQRFV